MRKKELPNEYKLILLCARAETNNSLAQEVTKLLNNHLDWKKIMEISSCQKITPFLYYNLSRLNPQDIISQPVFMAMKTHYYANLQRNLTIENEISRILKVTNIKEISFAPLKGLALLQSLYSRNPGLRIMDDVDILIKKDEFQKVKDILIQSGYRYNKDTKIREKYQYEFIFSKTLSSRINLFIEIHTLLNPPRPYEIKLPCLWQRMEENITAGEKTRCLSREDMFLSLAMHLRRHTRRLNLKFIIDIAELLNGADEFNNMGGCFYPVKRPFGASRGLRPAKAGLDWQYIMKSAKDNHIVNTIYFAIYISQELFNTPIAPKILKLFCPGRIKKHLICFVMNKHNFFTLKRWQGTALRFLLFDRLIDIIYYFWRVSLWERILNKRPAKKIPTAADENARK